MDGPVIALKQTLARYTQRPDLARVHCSLSYRLFQTQSFTDFTIICGPNTFNVHKAVISQSEYFAAACASGRFEEGQKGTITLKARGSGDDDDGSCDDPDAVKHMIHYFYHLDYNAAPPEDLASHTGIFMETSASGTPRHVDSQASSSERGRDSLSTVDEQSDSRPTKTGGNMAMHAHVFAAATKYHVPALQVLSACKFYGALRANWDHESFAEAARVVYTTTAEGVSMLREEVVQAITEHGSLLEKPAVEAVVRSINGLAYELLMGHRRISSALSTPPAKRVKANGRAGWQEVQIRADTRLQNRWLSTTQSADAYETAAR
ncbi:hypothetical protein LTR53_000287 [Teratosphaeriaceae sp. CCFEE 6253]|nr:hypothetical protein LTR53_000287 [Teratosphaeriaceae sp. CCFEE 6253]